MPINGFFDRDRSVDRDRPADFIFDIVLAPLEEIMVSLAPTHDTVAVPDGAQRRIELSRITRYCSSQDGLAESHAVKCIVARHKLFRPLWSADERGSLIACPAQSYGNEVDFLRDRAFIAGLINQ